MTAQANADGARRAAGIARLLLVHALQAPAVALIVFSDRDAAWWAAGIWSSLVCCLGTDSLWRWRNRLLVTEAIVWLVAASLFGTGTVP